MYAGVVHKCPNCGAEISSFMTNCPSCGYEVRETKSTSAVYDLSQRLGRIKNNNKKDELIRNFYVPNTKEDIYEFFILASSNMDSDDVNYDAWESKLEQTYNKAKLTFGNTSDFLVIDELYQKTKKHQKSKKISNKIRGIKATIIVVIGIILMIVGYFAGSSSTDGNSPFYMLAMVGMLIGGIGLTYGMSGKNKNRNGDK